MRDRTGWLVAAMLWLLAGRPCSAETPLHGRTEESLQEVAHQVNNPVAPLWQLTFDNQIVGLAGGGLEGVEPAYAGSFEPQGPVWLGQAGSGRPAWLEELGIFAQLVVPLVETVPVLRANGQEARSSGFGDIQLGAVLAPKRRSGFVWGIGPTFLFPSASDDALGQGKWQAGPAAIVGYVGSRWIGYALAEQWWSFAGDDDRPATNQLSLTYVLVHSLPGRWQVGTQPELAVDWTASRGNKVSFPVGLGVGRTVRVGGLPVQLWLEVDYYAVRPDDLSGARWGIDLQIAPVIPAVF